jgi:hypothetical protein
LCSVSNIMKRLTYISKLALLVLLFSGSVLGLRAQSAQEVFNAVSSSIGKANDVAIAAYFNASVEVTVPGSDQSYTSTQAQFVVKDFFAKNPPAGFKLLHNGESGGTWYATGAYSSAKGSFDTNIFLKKVGDKFLITQIRFELE